MKFYNPAIIPGRSRGMSIGFPTINIESKEVEKMYQPGVYAARVRIGETQYIAAVHIGPRPTFHDTSTIEIHLIDTVITEQPTIIDELEICHSIREVRAFANTEELKNQISKDIAAVRDILSEL